jgi:hypothetical protein
MKKYLTGDFNYVDLDNFHKHRIIELAKQDMTLIQRIQWNFRTWFIWIKVVREALK